MLDRLAALWAAAAATLEAHLFSIGDTPVTPLGIARVLFTVAAAALISRVVHGALHRVSVR